MDLDLECAQEIVGLVASSAKLARDEPIAIAVVGADGLLMAFAGMDGVIPISRQLAIDKAHTAVLGARDTIEREEEARPK